MKKALTLFWVFFCWINLIYSQKTDTMITKLIGKWNWIETNNGWGIITNPQTEGYNKSVILYQDTADVGTDSISFITYKDNNIILSGRTYMNGIKIYENVIDEDTNWFYPSHWYAVHFYYYDTIYFHPACADCNFYLYERDLLYNSIDQNSFIKSDIKLFPNPSNDFIQIDYKNAGRQNSTIEIINSFGQKAMLYKPSLITSYDKIDISRLPKGIYILRLTNDKTTISKKIIKE